jgi:hypothetical protein
MRIQNGDRPLTCLHRCLCALVRSSASDLFRPLWHVALITPRILLSRHQSIPRLGPLSCVGFPSTAIHRSGWVQKLQQDMLAVACLSLCRSPLHYLRIKQRRQNARRIKHFHCCILSVVTVSHDGVPTYFVCWLSLRPWLDFWSRLAKSSRNHISGCIPPLASIFWEPQVDLSPACFTNDLMSVLTECQRFRRGRLSLASRRGLEFWGTLDVGGPSIMTSVVRGAAFTIEPFLGRECKHCFLITLSTFHHSHDVHQSIDRESFEMSTLLSSCAIRVPSDRIGTCSCDGTPVIAACPMFSSILATRFPAGTTQK